MEPVVVSSPGLLPCSVDMALRQIRALPEDIDIVDLACRAAVAACEDYTGRIFVQTIFKVSFSNWPNFCPSWGIDRPRGQFPKLNGLDLPGSPLVAVNSLKYWPADGTAQVEWAEANYLSDRTCLPGRLVLRADVELPLVDTARPDAIEVEYESGYGMAQQDMPPQYLMTMLLFARHLFDNPSAINADGKAKAMPISYQYLLRALRV